MMSRVLYSFKIVDVKNIILFILILTFVSISCEKNDEELVKNALHYKVIIRDDNNQLKRVLFFTSTYFPLENETIVYGDGKSKKRELSSEKFLNRFDSIVYCPEMLVYSECTYYMSVTFHFNDTLNLLPKTCIMQDTIANIVDVTFQWPNDTIFF